MAEHHRELVSQPDNWDERGKNIEENGMTEGFFHNLRTGINANIIIGK